MRHTSRLPRLITAVVSGTVLLTLAACTHSTGAAPAPRSATAATVASAGTTLRTPTTASTGPITPTLATTTPAATRPAGPDPVSSTPRPSTRMTAATAVTSASPGFGATDLSPAQPIIITVSHGTIKNLTLTNPTGKIVKGSISPDRATWTLGEVLGFGKTYTATGDTVDAAGRPEPIRGTFTTVNAADQADSYITPGDDQVVGIAQPVIIRFPTLPTDKAAVERALTISTTPKVDGAWGWIHHDDGWGIDWRPKNYWPAGTKVHVQAHLYGLKYATGIYGSSDLSNDFTIGRAQVVYADARTYQITVRQGCTAYNDPNSCRATTATYPASFGQGDGPNSKYGLNPQLVTRSGIHVINQKLPSHDMSNPPYYTSSGTEYWDVRMSDNGEFIHENPNTVTKQGHQNVSHGCINLSPTNAHAYYTSALIGDPVEVTGTTVQLSAADGDIFDWTIGWTQWQNLSALSP